MKKTLEFVILIVKLVISTISFFINSMLVGTNKKLNNFWFGFFCILYFTECISSNIISYNIFLQTIECYNRRTNKKYILLSQTGRIRPFKFNNNNYEYNNYL